MLSGLGATFLWEPSAGHLRAELAVPDGSQAIPDTTLYGALRAAARGEVFPASPPAAGWRRVTG